MENWEVRSQIDAEVCAVETLSVVSRLSQLTSGIRGCPKQTWFTVFLKVSISYPQGSCRKPLEAPVPLTQSRTTLLACLQELRNWIE